MSSLPKNSITILFSGEAPYSIGDEKYPFKVDRSFYYYTGLDRENMALVLVKMAQSIQHILYLEPFDPLMAKWVGGKMLPEEAREISGIEDVRYIEDMKQDISSLLVRFGAKTQITLFGDLSRQYLPQGNKAAELFDELRNE